MKSFVTRMHDGEIKFCLLLLLQYWETSVNPEGWIRFTNWSRLEC